MTTSADPLLHALSSDEHGQVYRDVIAPRVLVGQAFDQPFAIVLGGRPASGKTSITRALLGDREMVQISSDRLRALHPQWPALLRADDTTAGFYTHHDARQWVEECLDDAVARRLPVLFDTAMDDPDRARRLLTQFRTAGYPVHAAFVAGNSALSRLGALDRYHTDRKRFGGARHVDDPDRSYPGVLASARLIDTEHLADTLTVYRRDGTVLYRNTLDASGHWTAPTGADTALHNEATRAWTVAESQWFTDTAERLSTVKADELAERMQPQWRPLLTEAIRAAQPFAHPSVADRLDRLENRLATTAPTAPSLIGLTRTARDLNTGLATLTPTAAQSWLTRYENAIVPFTATGTIDEVTLPLLQRLAGTADAVAPTAHPDPAGAPRTAFDTKQRLLRTAWQAPRPAEAVLPLPLIPDNQLVAYRERWQQAADRTRAGQRINPAPTASDIVIQRLIDSGAPPETLHRARRAAREDQAYVNEHAAKAGPLDERLQQARQASQELERRSHLPAAQQQAEQAVRQQIHTALRTAQTTPSPAPRIQGTRAPSPNRGRG